MPICPLTGSTFEVSAEDRELLAKLSPRSAGKIFELPAPSLCPDERKRRRLAFRNERNLYQRSCDLTGEKIISAYSPDKACKVYSKSAWWSDRWDARQYGRDFDFTRTFFEQFAELKREVPQIALITTPDADENNCSYVNFSGNSKNCYMTFDSDFNEDSYYSNVLKHSKNCLDCSYLHSSELCYESIDCNNCYALKYCQDCSNCNHSYFLHSCIGCSDCYMSCNLVQKSYYIMNQPYSREEYFKKIATLALGDRSSINNQRTQADLFFLRYPKKHCRILKTENCLGDYIINAKNCFYCFNIAEGQDLRYCDSLYDSRDCMDVSSFGEQIERVYNSGTVGINCFDILFSNVAVLNCTNLIYCDNCRQSKDCFGCSSMRSNQYCILNKQYTQSAYNKLLPNIIEHMHKTAEWGEFFPLELSAFGYNETIALEHFPLERSLALKLGANWSDYSAPVPDVTTLNSEDIPDSISEINSDLLLNRAISCQRSGKPFRLLKPELEFYQSNNIPIPVLHPNQRYQARMQRRNPQKLWERLCARSAQPIWTSYAPNRHESIYSEQAYCEALI